MIFVCGFSHSRETKSLITQASKDASLIAQSQLDPQLPLIKLQLSSWLGAACGHSGVNKLQPAPPTTSVFLIFCFLEQTRTCSPDFTHLTIYFYQLKIKHEISPTSPNLSPNKSYTHNLICFPPSLQQLSLLINSSLHIK